MFLQIGLFTLALCQIANSVSLPDEEIVAVELGYYCLSVEIVVKAHDRSPLLLIHGLSGSHRHWKGVQEVLAYRTGRRVCSVDLRNHGDSPWSNRTDIEAMAVDIGHFLDKQNITKVNLIGQSLGGKTAVHYALKYPERVDSLVVEDMRPNGMDKPALETVKLFVKNLLDAIKLVPDESTEDEAKKIIVDYLLKKFSEMGINTDLDKEAFKSFLEIRCILGKCELKTNPKLLQDFINDSDAVLTESKGLYEGPTLFIYGTASPFHVDKDKENILKLFPNAKLVAVDGAEHSIHGFHRKFEDEVIKFLN